MTSFRVEYDPDLWLQIPTRFPADEDATVESWAARQASGRRELGFVETADTGTLDQYFMDVHRIALQLGEHESVWALLARDASGFAAVVLDVTDADGSLDDLLAALIAPTDNQYAPATFSQIEAAGLGSGVCVDRFEFDANKRLYESIYYVFRVEDADFVLSTQSYEVALLEWATPRIQELIDGIHLTETAAS